MGHEFALGRVRHLCGKTARQIEVLPWVTAQRGAGRKRALVQLHEVGSGRNRAEVQFAERVSLSEVTGVEVDPRAADTEFSRPLHAVGVIITKHFGAE